MEKRLCYKYEWIASAAAVRVRVGSAYANKQGKIRLFGCHIRATKWRQQINYEWMHEVLGRGLFTFTRQKQKIFSIRNEEIKWWEASEEHKDSVTNHLSYRGKLYGASAGCRPPRGRKFKCHPPDSPISWSCLGLFAHLLQTKTYILKGEAACALLKWGCG